MGGGRAGFCLDDTLLPILLSGELSVADMELLKGNVLVLSCTFRSFY